MIRLNRKGGTIIHERYSNIKSFKSTHFNCGVELAEEKARSSTKHRDKKMYCTVSYFHKIDSALYT